MPDLEVTVFNQKLKLSYLEDEKERLTNAINMIDGIDGLASGIVLIAITGLICFNLTLELSLFTNILLAVASALLPVTIFNIAFLVRIISIFN